MRPCGCSRCLVSGSADFPAWFAPHRIIELDTDLILAREMALTAFRIQQHALSSYWLGYCSPSRSGLVATKVEVIGSSVSHGSTFEFSANGFSDGCTADILDGACENKMCGGFGCGGCDECVPRAKPTLARLLLQLAKMWAITSMSSISPIVLS